MLLVMYSRKETVLNIHIKTRNTLKKVLHWTVFFLFVCFVLIFFVHISYKTFTSTYLHSAKNTRCQWTYFNTFWWKSEQQKACTQRTFYQTRNTFVSMISSTLSSPITRLHIAYSPTYCIYCTHTANITVDWLSSRHGSRSNTVIKLDSNCLNVKTIQWL